MFDDLLKDAEKFFAQADELVKRLKKEQGINKETLNKQKVTDVLQKKNPRLAHTYQPGHSGSDQQSL